MIKVSREKKGQLFDTCCHDSGKDPSVIQFENQYQSLLKNRGKKRLQQLHWLLVMC